MTPRSRPDEEADRRKVLRSGRRNFGRRDSTYAERDEKSGCGQRSIASGKREKGKRGEIANGRKKIAGFAMQVTGALNFRLSPRSDCETDPREAKEIGERDEAGIIS